MAFWNGGLRVPYILMKAIFRGFDDQFDQLCFLLILIIRDLYPCNNALLILSRKCVCMHIAHWLKTILAMGHSLNFMSDAYFLILTEGKNDTFI